MNIPRPVLVRESILDSDRVCRLGLAQQLFFRNLLHVGDGAARFDADADDLRFTLYRRSLDRVKTAHIRLWLQELHTAGLITLYTRSGKAYGKLLNYGQLDKKRKVLHPAPDDEPELMLTTEPEPPPKAPPRQHLTAPPRPSEIEVNRREEERGAPSAPARDFEEWTEQIRAKNPHIDIDYEIAQAKAKRATQRKRFDTAWFERHWLPNCGTTYSVEQLMQAKAKPLPQIAEPDGWREILRETSYGPGGRFEITSWNQALADKDVLDYVQRELQRRRGQAA